MCGMEVHLTDSERILIIRVTVTKDRNRQYKYALSNAKENEFTTEELVQMQSQRYVCRTFFSRCKTGSRHEPIPGKRVVSMASSHGNGNDGNAFYIK